ncbi:unnamed protein product [Protopolystoma xenopodis]|uniref:Uncharacterized protein n=1 Tax=Protopolystoma xenopodis TaxID=117903 RepID=A0A448WLL4_9PLAT|nr:unnamed protein product [Protopolystoma xenopodis]
MTIPVAGNAEQLVPDRFRERNSVTFNLSSFGAGDSCVPLNYHLIVLPSSEAPPTTGQSSTSSSSSSSNNMRLSSGVGQATGLGLSDSIFRVMPGRGSDSVSYSERRRREAPPGSINVVDRRGTTLVNRTLTRADLFAVRGAGRQRCCFNVTGLSAGSYYQYSVSASNPAGKTRVSGFFVTRYSFGRKFVYSVVI